MAKWFSKKELDDSSFGCDNGSEYVNAVALAMLDEVREERGKAMVLTCSHRTEEWDISKGRSGKGDHVKGMGFDISIDSLKDAIHIIAIAATSGFNAFAINLEEGFVHIGFRPQYDVKIITWDY